MAARDPNSSNQSDTAPTGCLPLLLRLTWLLIGNFVLLLCAVQVAKGSSGLALDAAFFGVALALIGLRYVDIAFFNGRTTDGEPATLADWRRYAALMGVLAIGLWALARFAAAKGWM